MIVLRFDYQDDVKAWCDMRLSCVRSSAKDAAIPEIKILIGIIDECITCLAPMYSINQEFTRLGLDYYRAVSLAIEPKVNIINVYLRCGTLKIVLATGQAHWLTYITNAIRKACIIGVILETIF